MKVIYFDNNATTRVADEVLEAMRPFFSDLYGNPSSMHTFGGQVGRSRFSEAREQVAGLLGCDPGEIIFTSCGTESDNAAIHGSFGHRARTDARSSPPASSTRPCWRSAATWKPTATQVIELGVDKLGRLDLDELEHQLDNDTALVTIM